MFQIFDPVSGWFTSQQQHWVSMLCLGDDRDTMKVLQFNGPHIKLWPGPFCLFPVKSGLPPGTSGLSGNRGGGRSGKGRLKRPQK